MSHPVFASCVVLCSIQEEAKFLSALISRSTDSESLNNVLIVVSFLLAPWQLTGFEIGIFDGRATSLPTYHVSSGLHCNPDHPPLQLMMRMISELYNTMFWLFIAIQLYEVMLSMITLMVWRLVVFSIWRSSNPDHNRECSVTHEMSTSDICTSQYTLYIILFSPNVFLKLGSIK